jgi:hypothetical protein
MTMRYSHLSDAYLKTAVNAVNLGAQMSIEGLEVGIYLAPAPARKVNMMGKVLDFCGDPSGSPARVTDVRVRLGSVRQSPRRCVAFGFSGLSFPQGPAASTLNHPLVVNVVVKTGGGELSERQALDRLFQRYSTVGEFRELIRNSDRANGMLLATRTRARINSENDPL